MRITPNGDLQIKAIGRRRPSFGKARTRTLLRGLIEMTWCVGVLAGAAYLWMLPEPERSRTLDPLLESDLQVSIVVAGPCAPCRLRRRAGSHHLLKLALVDRVDRVWSDRAVADQASARLATSTGMTRSVAAWYSS